MPERVILVVALVEGLDNNQKSYASTHDCDEWVGLRRIESTTVVWSVALLVSQAVGVGQSFRIKLSARDGGKTIGVHAWQFERSKAAFRRTDNSISAAMTMTLFCFSSAAVSAVVRPVSNSTPEGRG